MFKTYLEALTDVGKAKMNILDKSSLLKRKKNWADIGSKKPKSKIKLVIDPTPQQLENFGWIVPEWSRSDTFAPGENIGFVRGIIYQDKFLNKVVLTVADTSEGNEVIHEYILEELQRLGRLKETKPLSSADYYDADIDHYLCIIQDGTNPAFYLSESYSHDMDGDEESKQWIDLYGLANGQYKIYNSLSKMYTNDLMDEVDGWGPPTDIDEIENVTFLMTNYIKNENLLDKFQNEDDRMEALTEHLKEKYFGMLEEIDLEEAIYNAYGEIASGALRDKFRKFRNKE